MAEIRRKITAREPDSQLGSAWYCTATSSRFPAHYHDDTELNVVVRGRVRYRVEGIDYELAPGSRIWFLPGALHELVHLSADAALWVFTMRAELGAPGPETSPGAVYEPVGSEAARRLVSELGCAIVKSRRLEVANHCLRTLLALPWQAGARARSSVPSSSCVIEAATAHLSDLESTLSIAEIAERAGVSHEHFTRRFTHACGVPPVYYRNHQRVQALVQLAWSSRATNLLHTALRVGFGSYAQFYRAFVQVTAGSPRERLLEFASDVLPARVSLVEGARWA